MRSLIKRWLGFQETQAVASMVVAKRTPPLSSEDTEELRVLAKALRDYRRELARQQRRR